MERERRPARMYAGSWPLIMCLLVCAAAASAGELRYAYEKGEQYRMVTRVNERVLINGTHSHQADILNRIAVKVTDVRDGSGLHDAVFQTSERAYGSSGTYEWSEDYDSVFWRDARGAFDIEDRYFMPVVRNVPLFPQKTVSPGETWSAAGWEVHDFRASFGLQDPFSFPITVAYTYLRDEVRNGIDCAVIGISYTVFQKLTTVPRTTRTYPVRLAGTSAQTLWWDKGAGRELAYTETFDFLFTLATGDEVEYVGEASGELIEAKPLDRAATTAEIKSELERQKVEGASVRSDDLGVTITLENVNFQANSDTLLPTEQEKLRRIASILRNYPDRDILVTGHTAGVSGYTAQQHQELSELRAKAVGDFLLSLGARSAGQITTRGMGAGFPIGDNATEEGRRRNRRVQITILEN
ncbi:MAG: OmpA family protein [Spirochaetes bacterium]|nr:OmpA family protein [Spirochaetota bacterium]